MKLRNRENNLTGKLTHIDFDIDDDEKEIDLTILLDNSDGECIDRQFYSLAELKGFLRDWEEYEPTEPLIKDPKIRKAVRAWAETNSIDKIIIFDYINDSPYVSAGEVKFAEFGGHFDIRFRTDEKFDTDKIYTVTELCGEEEE